jgi:hypothetical protein
MRHNKAIYGNYFIYFNQNECRLLIFFELKRLDFFIFFKKKFREGDKSSSEEGFSILLDLFGYFPLRSTRGKKKPGARLRRVGFPYIIS